MKVVSINKKPIKKRGKQIKRDWEAILTDVRLGQLSLRAIGRKYKIDEAQLRRKIKTKGIQRDLTQKVRTAVKNKLARNKAKTKPEGKSEELTDEEIVDAAAFQEIVFIDDWDKRFKSTLEKVRVLKKEILADNAVVRHRGEEKIERGYTPSEKASMLNAITQAEQRIFEAMRKNFGIDKADSKPTEMPDIYIDYGTGEYEAELNKRKSS